MKCLYCPTCFLYGSFIFDHIIQQLDLINLQHLFFLTFEYKFPMPRRILETVLGFQRCQQSVNSREMSQLRFVTFLFCTKLVLSFPIDQGSSIVLSVHTFTIYQCLLFCTQCILLEAFSPGSVKLCICISYCMSVCSDSHFFQQSIAIPYCSDSHFIKGEMGF